MPRSCYTLTGFGDFWERRVVKFLEPLPSFLVCSACGVVPSNARMLSCCHVLCMACREQVHEDEGCPFRDGGCLQPKAVLTNCNLRMLERFTVLCRNECEFAGTLSSLKEHLVRYCSGERTCMKCCQYIAAYDAVDHRRRCSGTIKPAEAVKAAVLAHSAVIKELSVVRKDLEGMVKQIACGESGNGYLVKYGNSIVEQLALIECNCGSTSRDPVLAKGGGGEEASTSKRPQHAATPHRAASRPNAFASLCTFYKIGNLLRSLGKNREVATVHPRFVLGGYCFTMECVLQTHNREATVHFTVALRSGPWDDRLFWPFTRTVTVILSHPTDSKKDIKLPVSLSGYRMSKKPAPRSLNDPDSTGHLLWADVERIGIVDDGTIYANVELA
ncbi:hypothetical protein HPB50_006971 [Hyalomma asiaticum]|uniref:Uncharacterized protein n=1 Tax=Hyalomma asiaticum TaxID=266040 RepID=A0ACB7TDG7_HYAAI|nr:hypothetical protein HPB50_006971 [Hyalomma asiaticum]